MKSIVKYLIFVQVFLIMLVAASLADTYYVGNVIKVTLRTGAGVDHKIVAILSSGDHLEMMERNSDWSNVKTVDGKEGWVLTRFVTDEIPLVYVVDELKKKNGEYSELVAGLKKENAEFVQTKEKLNSMEKSYNRLKKESAEFLALEKKYKKATSRFKEQQDRIADLEKSLGNEEIKWFLSGSGVLIAGLLLGMSARKKRTSSLL